MEHQKHKRRHIKIARGIAITVAIIIFLAILIWWFSTRHTTTVPLTAVAAVCAASGASNAIYIQGTVTSTDSLGKTQVFTDECADTTHLIKYICYESPVGSGRYTDGRTIIICPKGCTNSVCRK